MKKLLLSFLFCTLSAIAFAQMGIGIYPVSSMVSLRWNPKKIVRDSAGVRFVRDEHVHVEARTSFTVTHSSRGNSFTAQPELAGFFRFAGESGKPMLFSGVGGFLIFSHNGLSNAGGFIPLKFEYSPSLNSTHNLIFSAEADAFVTATWSKATFRIRPLLCITWMFDQPSAKKR